jgi:quinol-cytochrome oxidoreductase complex cytochrome b subunit
MVLGVPAFSSQNSVSSPAYATTMFAGALIEVTFLIAGLIAMHIAAVLASRRNSEANTSPKSLEMK